MSHSFKVGDRVRVLDNVGDRDSFNVGDVCTVSKVSYDLITCTNGGTMFSRRFESVKNNSKFTETVVTTKLKEVSGVSVGGNFFSLSVNENPNNPVAIRLVSTGDFANYSKEGLQELIEVLTEIKGAM